jgi:hypothetical protein
MKGIVDMFCNKCGTKYDEDSKFCMSCGNAREVQPPPPPDTYQQPPPPPPDTYQQPPPPPPQQFPQPEPMMTGSPPAKKKKSVAIIIAAAVIAIGLGIGAYFMFFHNADDGADEEGINLRAIPNVERIINDLIESGQSIVPNTETITDVEIIEEETNTETRTHQVEISISSHDNDVSYIRYAIIIYQRNENREWIFSEIWAEAFHMWTMTPLRGVNEDIFNSAVGSALMNSRFELDGEHWDVNHTVLESFTVNSRNTDLRNLRDIIVMDVVLSDVAMIARGQVELDFVFSYGWFLNSSALYPDFVGELKPEAVFELTNEGLLNDLSARDLTMMISTIGYIGHMELFTADEIENITNLDYTASNKNQQRLYTFSFNITRGVIVYEVNALVLYEFNRNNGWEMTGFEFSSENNEANLDGTRWVGSLHSKWLGTDLYETRQTYLAIEIETVNADGRFTAILTAAEPEYQVRSSGIFDKNALTLNFTFDEWIVEPIDNGEGWSGDGNYEDHWESVVLPELQLSLIAELNFSGIYMNHTSQSPWTFWVELQR